MLSLSEKTVAGRDIVPVVAGGGVLSMVVAKDRFCGIVRTSWNAVAIIRRREGVLREAMVVGSSRKGVRVGGYVVVCWTFMSKKFVHPSLEVGHLGSSVVKGRLDPLSITLSITESIHLHVHHSRICMDVVVGQILCARRPAGPAAYTIAEVDASRLSAR